MAADYNYVFTARAERDLNDILSYISEELCNPTATGKLANKIFESIDAVLAYPLTGKLVENEYLTDKTIRRILVDNYTIYYKCDDERKIIYIIRLAYSKRNPDDIAKSI